jgi:hypothetical protein
MSACPFLAASEDEIAATFRKARQGEFRPPPQLMAEDGSIRPIGRRWRIRSFF